MLIPTMRYHSMFDGHNFALRSLFVHTYGHKSDDNFVLPICIGTAVAIFIHVPE